MKLSWVSLLLLLGVVVSEAENDCQFSSEARDFFRVSFKSKRGKVDLNTVEVEVDLRNIFSSCSDSKPDLELFILENETWEPVQSAAGRRKRFGKYFWSDIKNVKPCVENYFLLRSGDHQIDQVLEKQSDEVIENSDFSPSTVEKIEYDATNQRVVWDEIGCATNYAIWIEDMNEEYQEEMVIDNSFDVNSLNTCESYIFGVHAYVNDKEGDGTDTYFTKKPGQEDFQKNVKIQEVTTDSVDLLMQWEGMDCIDVYSIEIVNDDDDKDSQIITVSKPEEMKQVQNLHSNTIYTIFSISGESERADKLVKYFNFQ